MSAGSGAATQEAAGERGDAVPQASQVVAGVGERAQIPFCLFA